MTLLTDHLFAQKLSYKLERFKRKSVSLYNFRCNLCGDSKTNKVKTRAYLYEKQGKLVFHCHNCNQSMPFGKFLKQTDSSLYREYLFEEFKGKNDTQTIEEPPKPEITTKETKINLPSLEDVGKGHLAHAYMLNRKVSTRYFKEIYYAKNFEEFVMELKPDYEKELGKEPRIVLPFRNEKGILVGVSGRDLLGRAKSKYMTIKLGQDDIKYFSKDKLNYNKKVYVVEGPIDSYFLPNSVATMDANLISIIRQLKSDLDYTFIFDNEPRNPAIVSGMNKAIEYGYKIFIRPSYVKEKDINDMVLAGYENIDKLIDQHTYEGFEARVKMTEWLKK